jgi:hypothetical protein
MLQCHNFDSPAVCSGVESDLAGHDCIMAPLAIKPSCWAFLTLAAGCATPLYAQDDPWGPLRLAPPPGETESVGETALPPGNVPEPDWSLLNTDASFSATASPRSQRSLPVAGNTGLDWSGQNKADGTEAVTVKQALSPVWDTRVGADLTVAPRPGTLTTNDLLREKYSVGSPLTQSRGSAWAAMTAPGVGALWDKTAIEARVDPTQDQSKLGTSFSKSVPIGGNQYSLTLQNGYNVVQQGSTAAIGYNGRPVRSYETDQLAKLSIADTGTSFIAGQTLSTTDDRWLRKVGAEQKLFGGVNITGSISETLTGPSNKSLTAGFKHSW